MFSRPLKFAVAALIIGTGALGAEEARKCSASARECEQVIRGMLSGRRYLGVQLEEIASGGLVIKAIVTESPAEHAGLILGDRLMAVNGRPTKDATIKDFKQILNDASRIGRLFVIVQRHGQLKKVDVRLEPYSKVQIDKIVAQHLAQAHPSTATAPQP
jgi:predicted metalloprotease with PDZ domain